MEVVHREEQQKMNEMDVVVPLCLTQVSIQRFMEVARVSPVCYLLPSLHFSLPPSAFRLIDCIRHQRLSAVRPEPSPAVGHDRAEAAKGAHPTAASGEERAQRPAFSGPPAARPAQLRPQGHGYQDRG